MSSISRRAVLSAGAATAALGAVAACSSNGSTSRDSGGGPGSGNGGTGTPAGTGKPVQGTPLGDGSNSDTGSQPNQPKPEKLKPGEQPPQFVVFSWDGAGATDDGQFSRFLKLAEQYKASMTFFLSGIYTLPKEKSGLYHPRGTPWARRTSPSCPREPSATRSSSSARPGWPATRSAPTSTVTSARPGVTATVSTSGRRRTGRARSSRPSRS
ncbi:hypothetical protein GCM10025734_33780 [Kitasatospora paranensis]